MPRPVHLRSRATDQGSDCSLTCMISEHEELMNHLTNGSFILVDRDNLPPSHAKHRLVKFTWAYKIKRSGKLKARLCVQGCTQVAGVD